MSTNTTPDQSYVPQIRQHARDRWHERFSPDRPLVIAWRQATPVETPAAWADAARVYEPENALLLVRAGALRTVLYNDGRLTGEGFTVCEACCCPVDPITDDTCPNCQTTQPPTRECGNITVVQGSGER